MPNHIQSVGGTLSLTGEMTWREEPMSFQPEIKLEGTLPTRTYSQWLGQPEDTGNTRQTISPFLLDRSIATKNLVPSSIISQNQTFRLSHLSIVSSSCQYPESSGLRILTNSWTSLEYFLTQLKNVTWLTSTPNGAKGN